MKQRVTVTKADINRARWLRGQSEELLAYSCPIALAMQRKFLTKVKVGTVYWCALPSIDKDEIRERLPLSAQDFIQSFDERKPVKPFQFYVNWPKWAWKRLSRPPLL